MGIEVVDNWVTMALIATSAWALSCVMDVCFVGNGIYRKPSDGLFVAGLFCIVPALLLGVTIQPDIIDPSLVLVTAFSAVAFLLHVYFYFRALFLLNDAVNAEIFNTLAVFVVPILAFLFLGERLPALQYFAIVLATVGVLILIRFQAVRMSWLAIAYLLASVAAGSAMMVLQAWALSRADYGTVVFLFTASAFLIVVCILAFRRQERTRVTQLCRQFGALFVLLQLLEIAGVLASQRATDLGPSVSLVALIESSLPVFIMLYSLLLAAIVRKWNPEKVTALQSALSLQTAAAPTKLVSMLMIIVAIVLVQV